MYRYFNYCGMQTVGCCFRTHKGFMPGAGADAEEVIVQQENNVSLDMSNMGKEVVIVKNGKRICGSGGALANISIAQNKCYFEIRIQSLGFDNTEDTLFKKQFFGFLVWCNWSFGVATTNCDLNQLPLGKDDQSWVLCSSGLVMHNSTEVDKVSLNLNEGDCIGCSYDHVEMHFYLNGKNLYCPMRKIKGTVRPVVSVEDGCIIDVNFDSFVFPPPSGFQKLMVEIDLM